MTSSRTICLVYFALLFGAAYATNTPSDNSSETTNNEKQNDHNNPTPTINTNNNIDVANTMSETTNNSQQPSCPPATPEPAKGQCILFLPTGDTLQLVVVALTVGCLVLLLTTLISVCQVCHLRRIISILHLRQNNVDLRAIREKSEYKHESHVDGHPTETCFMLSEVTGPQEERREDEQSVLGNKTEENTDTEQPSTEKNPNGDVAQENSHEADAKAPESSDTGV